MRLKTYTYVANISKKTHQQLDEFLYHLTDLYNAAKNILNRGIEEFSGGNKENNEIVFSRRTTKRELVQNSMSF